MSTEPQPSIDLFLHVFLAFWASPHVTPIAPANYSTSEHAAGSGTAFEGCLGMADKLVCDEREVGELAHSSDKRNS